jgi:glycine/D-amino acid oxidase-like deaminating enzyme
MQGERVRGATLLAVGCDHGHLTDLTARIGQQGEARGENAVVVGDQDIHGWEDSGQTQGAAGRRRTAVTPSGTFIPVRNACLWLESIPSTPPEDPATLPSRADVAIIGGGYTGLSAARALAVRGAAVVVLERDLVGAGASGRNGGFVLPGFKPDPLGLVRQHGAERARALFDLSRDAVAGLEALVRQEALGCGYVRSGHLTVAGRVSHLTRLAAVQRTLERWDHPTVLLDRRDLGQEIGSERYVGGLLDPAGGLIQPAALLAGLAGAARGAGALVRERTEAERLIRERAGWRVTTPAGDIHAAQVLIASDGHTGALHPALQRRVVPVGSHVIATVPLPPHLARRLLPRGRAVNDTRHLLAYYRLSPDDRLVFGGRVSFAATNADRAAVALRRAMITVFPELADTPIEYVWSGSVGFTRSQLPHAGALDGVAFALGYCGHGVALSTHLGAWMGEALAGARPFPPLADDFRAIPWYRGKPWFLPAVDVYYRLADAVS